MKGFISILLLIGISILVAIYFSSKGYDNNYYEIDYKKTGQVLNTLTYNRRLYIETPHRKKEKLPEITYSQTSDKIKYSNTYHFNKNDITSLDIIDCVPRENINNSLNSVFESLHFKTDVNKITIRTYSDNTGITRITYW